MVYIVDIILAVIFALIILISAKKGFFRSFIDFAGSTPNIGGKPKYCGI
jgi:hypothetical protein